MQEGRARGTSVCRAQKKLTVAPSIQLLRKRDCLTKTFLCFKVRLSDFEMMDGQGGRSLL